MSQDWVEEAFKDTEDFFEDASDEEIEEALEEANYEFYKDVEVPTYLIPAYLEK